MKLGLGLYRHQLDREHFQFAKQCGCTHLVIHLVDYFRSSRSNRPGDQPVGDDTGWGLAGDPAKLWSYEEIAAIKKEINAAGLELEAIENFDPAHWHDVLLDGPKKLAQIENLKQIIRNVGRAGVPVFGYNFSIAGVAGRVKGKFARGDAEAVGMDGPLDKPLPNGMVWNMVYDQNAQPGTVPSATPEQLWSRLKFFLDELIPVAEEAGVTLAAHPDDPPLATVRGQPRLVWRPELYQKLIDLKPSPRNALEFCVGTIAEMAEGQMGDRRSEIGDRAKVREGRMGDGRAAFAELRRAKSEIGDGANSQLPPPNSKLPSPNVYTAVETYSRQKKLAYVHLRNVRDKAPYYKETFIDDGDVDVLRVLRILKENHFDGVIIPDHAPQMACAAPWHAGMAYALGFLQAGLKALGA